MVDPGQFEGAIFVAANSEAGKYAARIHDKKGIDWENRGIGTIAKGPQADDKFIERALEVNEDAIRMLIEAEMDKVKL